MGNVVSSLFDQLSSFFNHKNSRILMVGLDNAGKTSILYKMRLNQTVATIPTIGFNVESIEYKNITFTVWDIGGQAKIRELWRVYIKGSQGLIFVIDSCDTKRIAEAKSELFSLLDEEELKCIPLLIFANKQDVIGSTKPADLKTMLGLTTISNRSWYVQPSCATTGEGLKEGFDWFVAQIRYTNKQIKS